MFCGDYHNLDECYSRYMQSIYLFIYPSIYSSIHLSIYLCYLSIYASIHPFYYSSIHRFLLATLLEGLVARIRNAHELSTAPSLTDDLDSIIDERSLSSEGEGSRRDNRGDNSGVPSEEENTTVRKEMYVRSQSRVRSESYHKYLAEDSVGDENMDGE